MACYSRGNIPLDPEPKPHSAEGNGNGRGTPPMSGIAGELCTGEMTLDRRRRRVQDDFKKPLSPLHRSFEQGDNPRHSDIAVLNRETTLLQCGSRVIDELSEAPSL
jgi:hypothetical protein